MGASVKPETLAERAARLAGGQQESLAARAQRLAGATAEPPKESVRLDVRAPSESTGALPHNRPNRDTGSLPNLIPGLMSAPAGLVEVAKEPETREAALGLLSSAGQLPGMKAVQAGARALTRGQSYREAHDDITAANEKVPGEIRAVSKIPGLVAAAPLLPANPAAAGAILGATDQALDADPDRGLVSRGVGAVAGAAIGGTLGKVLDVGSVLGRAAIAKSIGKNATLRAEQATAASKTAYDKAAQQATAAGGTHPAVANALNHPAVAPFTKAVKATQALQGADDATVLREAYKLMSETQRRLGRTMVNADDFRAGSSLQKSDIEIGKRELLKAADKLMPGYRSAVEQHAKMAGETEAFQEGANVARQLIGKTTGSATKAAKKGPEAFGKRIAKMTPEEKKAAVEGILGRLKERIGPQPNMISGFGAATTLMRPARVAPLLRQLGTTDQKVIDEITRMALLAATAGT